MQFSKMHANGNDFVIIDLRSIGNPSQKFIKEIADRNRGVGCDCVIGILNPRNHGSAAQYRVWTPNGEESTQCANGARCAAQWLYETSNGKLATRFRLDGPTTTHTMNVHTPSRTVSMTMSRPAEIITGYDLGGDSFDDAETVGPARSSTLVSLSNEHIVLEYDSIRDLPVSKIGPSVQSAPAVRPQANINFARIIDRVTVDLRVYENGSGETLCCGSGACATAAALFQQDKVDSALTIRMAGGEVRVMWHPDEENIDLIGPVEAVYEGTLS